jgi:Ca2+-binding RTX toxin-like protein
VKQRIIIAVAALAGGLILAPSARAAVTCEYDEAGAPGPAENVLAIETTDTREGATVARSGAAIRVRAARTGALVTCSGPAPTVTNLDSITFNGKRQGAALVIDHRGGPFAPGATAEGGNDSEIEFDLTTRRGRVVFVGTGGSDTFAFGEIPRGGPNSKRDPAANLNQTTELAKDADVIMNGVATIVVRLGGGSDVTSGRGGVEFAGPVQSASFDVRGGPGGDFITGGGRADLLVGGGGPDLLRGDGGGDRVLGGAKRDRLVGGGGGDFLKGGGGRDRALAGAGDDRLALKDGVRDFARCGPGRDGGRADRKDRLRGCEAVRRG